jgi:hypothetical protein
MFIYLCQKNDWLEINDTYKEKVYWPESLNLALQ